MGTEENFSGGILAQKKGGLPAHSSLLTAQSFAAEKKREERESVNRGTIRGRRQAVRGCSPASDRGGFPRRGQLRRIGRRASRRCAWPVERRQAGCGI